MDRDQDLPVEAKMSNSLVDVDVRTPGMDGIYSRFRSTESELHGVKTRVGAIEGRVSSMEIMLTAINSDLRNIQASLAVSQRDRDHMNRSLNSLNEDFAKHYREEAARQHDHTRSIQKLSRTILWVGTSAAIFVMLLVAALGEEGVLLKALSSGVVGG